MTEPGDRSMRVVVATDGSACADTALELARAIAWPAGSVIWLVTALESDDAIVSAAWTPVVSVDIEQRLAEMVEAASAMLEAEARAFAATGARVETAVLRGRPGTSIVDKAESIGADLIILGSRGHGTIGSMVLGSTSAEVADHAHCPVLVARRPALARAVFGTDGSAYARVAENVIVAWPIFERVAVDAVSVARMDVPWTSSLVLSSSPVSPEEMAQVGREIVAEAQKFADDARGRLSAAGRKATAHVAQGDAATELIRVAKDTAADLIVVATHGRTGMRRLLAGSVARNVMLHAHCSVMVVREVRPLT